MDRQIALLATGDEITTGDITNTNGPRIAQQLTENQIAVGMHLHVSDEQAEMEAAMQFLLQHHHALIITGGLGPTSDDRTRYALANVLQRPLHFHEDSWERILQRFRRHHLALPAESNQRQAYFPQGGETIRNDNGSAEGCWLIDNDKLIALLPGPPSECLPMFERDILPRLLAPQYQHNTRTKRWLLFGVSESHIADLLDQSLQHHNVTTAYRLWPPYIEFKLHYQHENDLYKAQQQIAEIIQPYRLASFELSACKLLQQALLANPSQRVYINDQATQGHFLNYLLQEIQLDNIIACNRPPSDGIYIHITGLDDYWHDTVQDHQLPLTIDLHNERHQHQVPYRQQRTLAHAIELIAYEILQTL